MSMLLAVPCQTGRGLSPATAHSLLYMEKPEKWAAFFPCDYHIVGARNACVKVALEDAVDRDERAVAGAMRALQSKSGLLVGPTDHVTLPKKGEVGLVPWTYWS